MYIYIYIYIYIYNAYILGSKLILPLGQPPPPHVPPEQLAKVVRQVWEAANKHITVDFSCTAIRMCIYIYIYIERERVY